MPGPPSQPVVNLTTGCNTSNAPYVNLAWAATTDTDNYDIIRDSLPLVSGLEQTAYQDLNVGATTSYSYQVLANGPVGNTLSDPVSITTNDCVSIIPADCQIIAIGGKELAAHPEGVETTDNTPLITGTTNITNAIIQITISPGSIISATTTANANGYWSWQTPIRLSDDSYTLLVTATDPNNGSNFYTTSAAFEIKEEDEEEKEETKKKVLPPPTTLYQPKPVPEPTPEPEKEAASLNLLLQVENPGKKVFAGGELLIQLELEAKNRQLPAEDKIVYFEILDQDNRILTGSKSVVNFAKTPIYETSLAIPALTDSGRYKVVAKFQVGNKLVMAEDYFEVSEMPFINLGGGAFVTLTQIARLAGWILLWLLIILLIFLLLLILEHHLSKQADFHITENFLSRKGYFTRKGVSR